MTTRSILHYVVPALALALASVPAAAATVRIYVTNSAGDSIHVIDPVTNKVMQEIKDVIGAHGIAFSPDATRVYVSNEETSTLDVFDRKSGKRDKNGGHVQTHLPAHLVSSPGCVPKTSPVCVFTHRGLPFAAAQWPLSANVTG